MESYDLIFEKFADELGPIKTVHVYDPRSGMKGIVVIDNVARGPAIGGVRLSPDIDTEEVVRLARTMTLKNAAAGLPHGGGKAGIVGDPHTANKEVLLRAFARKIRDLTDYIPGPDMGTDEECMGYIHDEIGRCIGKPRAFGGIPLDEIGATGYGLSRVGGLALSHAGISLEGATLAVQGFGNVGRHAAAFLARQGVRLIAVSDTTGTLCREDGLDVDALIRVKKEEGSVLAYGAGSKMTKDEIFAIPCDIFIPAAQPDVITEANVGTFKAKVVLEGANIPVTEEAERLLHDRGVLCIPDFIANAGGVICAAVEHRGGSEGQAFETIREKLERTTRELLSAISRENLYPREAATRMALERVKAAMALRR